MPTQAHAHENRTIGSALRALSRVVMIALLAALPLVTAGCGPLGCQDAPDGAAVLVSQQAAQRLQARLEQIAAAARPDFILEMTDEEATSYLSLNLIQTAVTDAEVRVLEGKVRLSGRVAQILNLPVSTLWTAQVVDGRVRVKIESASVACIPIPAQLLDSLSGTLNQMIVESQVSIQVREIKLAPGRATITGSKTR